MKDRHGDLATESCTQWAFSDEATTRGRNARCENARCECAGEASNPFESQRRHVQRSIGTQRCCRTNFERPWNRSTSPDGGKEYPHPGFASERRGWCSRADPRVEDDGLKKVLVLVRVPGLTYGQHSRCVLSLRCTCSRLSSFGGTECKQSCFEHGMSWNHWTSKQPGGAVFGQLGESQSDCCHRLKRHEPAWRVERELLSNPCIQRQEFGSLKHSHNELQRSVYGVMNTLMWTLRLSNENIPESKRPPGTLSGNFSRICVSNLESLCAVSTSHRQLQKILNLGRDNGGDTATSVWKVCTTKTVLPKQQRQTTQLAWLQRKTCALLSGGKPLVRCFSKRSPAQQKRHKPKTLCLNGDGDGS